MVEAQVCGAVPVVGPDALNVRGALGRHLAVLVEAEGAVGIELQGAVLNGKGPVVAGHAVGVGRACGGGGGRGGEVEADGAVAAVEHAAVDQVKAVHVLGIAEGVAGDAVGIVVIGRDDIVPAEGDALGHLGGVGSPVGHIGVFAVIHRGDVIGRASGKGIRRGAVVVGRQVLDGDDHSIAGVGGVGEGHLHRVGVGLVHVGVDVGQLHVNGAVKGVPQVLDDRGVLGAGEGVGRRSGSGHGVGGVIQAGEGEHLHQILPVAVLDQVVNASGIGLAAGAGGVDGVAGEEEGVAVAGGVGGAEVDQIVVRVGHAGEGVVPVLVQGKAAGRVQGSGGRAFSAAGHAAA